MNDDTHTYSSLAQTAYIRNKKDKLKFMAKKDLLEYGLDSGLTDKEHSVFFNPVKNEVVLSVRGTEPTKISDLTADLATFLGLEKLSPRYKRAQRKLNELEQKYPDSKVVLTGHSLGGTVAEQLARANKLEAHLFNKGSSYLHSDKKLLQKLMKRKDTEEHQKRIKNYIVAGDPISFSSVLDPTLTTVVVKPKDMHVHGLQHFQK